MLLSLVHDTVHGTHGGDYIGPRRIPAGRLGEAPSVGLSATLTKAGFALGRLQTGTPARLDARSIDFSKMIKLKGDDEPVPFSYLNRYVDNAVRFFSNTLDKGINFLILDYYGYIGESNFLLLDPHDS